MKRIKNLCITALIIFLCLPFLNAANSAPSLSWTGETNYTYDGLNPESGYTTTSSFVFRVKYTDYDNDPPYSGYPKVHIKKNGIEISGSPFTMSSAYVNTYSAGRIYSYSTYLNDASTNYTYYFEAYDSYSNYAPTLSGTGPTVYSLTSYYYIRGYVKDYNGIGISGVSVSLSGAYSSSYLTSSSGYYEFLNLNSGGNYTVSVYRSGYNFSPINQSYSNLSANQDNQNFTGSYNSVNNMYYYVRGYVKDSSGTGISGVMMSLTGSASGSYITDSIGYYEFQNLNSSGQYTITPSKLNYTFSPSSQYISNLYYNMDSQNYVGTGSGATGGVTTVSRIKLKDAYSYPSPAYISRGDMINFATVTPNATAAIISTGGYLIKKLYADSLGKIAPWNGRNEDGEIVGTGIYIVNLTDDNNDKASYSIVIIK